MKKQVMFALLAMLTISILPGCGKSKNNEAPVIVGGVAAPAPTTYPSTGNVTYYNGCFDLRYAQNQSVTLYFQGQGYVSQATGSVYSYTQASQSGGFPGMTHYRNNSSGDSLQVYVLAGNNTTTYAVATLAPATVAAINQYFGGYICAIDVNSPASNGYLTISASFVGANGYISKQYLSL